MVNSRWLNTDEAHSLEQEVTANRNKLAKCFDTVILDNLNLTLSNESSGHSETIGLPSGGSGVFTAHNSVSTTGREITFGLSTGGSQSAYMYPSNWEVDIGNSIKTIVLDGTSIRAKRHDDSLVGGIAWADPTDVSNLQSDLSTVEADLQNLEGEVDSKCVKTLEIRDGVLKGKRMDGSFTGNIPVILTTTLDAATAALNYIKNTDLTTALANYNDEATSDSRYVNTSDLNTAVANLGYQTLTQIQALGFALSSDLTSYLTKTTTSTWTSTVQSLSTEVHNKETPCNYTKRIGLQPNKPYAQANQQVQGIFEFVYTDGSTLDASGGQHYNLNNERLSVPRLPGPITVVGIPGKTECFNHHFDCQTHDFHLSFNITKWTSSQIDNTWSWQEGETRLVLFCKPTRPTQSTAYPNIDSPEWREPAPGNYLYDYPGLAIPRKGIHVNIEANDSWPTHATYGGQTKKIKIAHYSGTTWNSWASSGSGSSGVGLPDAESYNVTIQAKGTRLFVRIQPLGQPRAPVDPAVTEFGTDATIFFNFDMLTEFGTASMDAADAAGYLYYSNGGNIMITTYQNIELSHFKLLCNEVPTPKARGTFIKPLDTNNNGAAEGSLSESHNVDDVEQISTSTLTLRGDNYRFFDFKVNFTNPLLNDDYQVMITENNQSKTTTDYFGCILNNAVMTKTTSYFHIYSVVDPMSMTTQFPSFGFDFVVL